MIALHHFRSWIALGKGSVLANKTLVKLRLGLQSEMKSWPSFHEHTPKKCPHHICECL